MGSVGYLGKDSQSMAKHKVNQAELSWYGKGIKKQDGHIWYGVGGGKLTGCGINHQVNELKSHCCLEEE